MIDVFALGVALTGGAVTGLGVKAYQNRDISALKRTWKNTLIKCHVSNVRLKEGETFRTFVLHDVRRFSNGYKAKTLIPLWLNLEALESAKGTLEHNLNSKIEISKDTYCKWVNIIITTNRPVIVYKKIVCEEKYLFGGYRLDGKPNLINLDIDAHLLWTGTTGTGKTLGLFMAITNLLANRKKHKHFQLYFG